MFEFNFSSEPFRSSLFIIVSADNPAQQLFFFLKTSPPFGSRDDCSLRRTGVRNFENTQAKLDGEVFSRRYLAPQVDFNLTSVGGVYGHALISDGVCNHNREHGAGRMSSWRSLNN